MKKVLSLALAVLMLLGSLSLFSCSSAADKNSVEKIKASGKLTVYTEAGFAPYEFIFENKIIGVDIAIMQKVADKLGVTLDVQDVNFDNICGAVQSGKAAAGAAGMTINAERLESVDFSIPYSSTEQYVVVAIDNAAIKSMEDLKGKQIGVQQGTTSDSTVDKLIKDGDLAGTTLTGYTTPTLAAAALGKIDAVVTDKLTAQIIVENNSTKYKTFKLVKADGSDVVAVEEYGICVAKGNESLLAVINEVLTELMKDDTISNWINEYSEKATQVEEEKPAA